MRSAQCRGADGSGLAPRTEVCIPTWLPNKTVIEQILLLDACSLESDCVPGVIYSLK
jgi:hypothetical protein